MKIAGITYLTGREEMLLKNDSSMLTNRKPLFVPDDTVQLGGTMCLVLRVSRLGKAIEPRYAERYYDAVAVGMDFVKMDMLQQAISAGHSWVPAYAFDGSLAIGEWLAPERLSDVIAAMGEPVCSVQDAIARLSEQMTIRQGDLIYITAKVQPRTVERGTSVSIPIEGEEKLFCRIK